MTIEYTNKFKRVFSKFPREIKKKLYKQASFLLNNLRHPSLYAKKFDEADDIWQARVDKNVRFYFKIKNDIYILKDIKNHPK